MTNHILLAAEIDLSISNFISDSSTLWGFSVNGKIGKLGRREGANRGEMVVYGLPCPLLMRVDVWENVQSRNDQV